MLAYFDEEAEAARISFAGTLVALRATGVKIVEARLRYPDDPILKIAPEQIMAGFEDQQLGSGNLESCVGEHVPYENPSMARRMMLAQIRSILAGRAALESADITGTLNLLDTSAFSSCDNWAQALLDTFAEVLDIDEQTKEVFLEEILKDARRTVGRNWELIMWIYAFMRVGEEDGENEGDIAGMLRGNFFTKHSEDFPVTASGADAIWREVEETAAILHHEQ